MQYTLAALAANAVPLVTLPVFARVLTKEDFGLLALSEVYAVFVAGLAMLGSNIAFERNYFAAAQDRKRLGELVYSILAFISLNFVLLLIITWTCGDVIARFLFRLPGKADVIFLDMIGAFLTSVLDLLLVFWRNRGQSRVFLAVTVVNAVCYVALVLAFVLGPIPSVQGVLLAKAIVLALVCAALLMRLPAHCTPALSLRALKETWQIGLPLTPRFFLGIFGTKIDRYLVNALGSLGGVGIYSIGQKIGYLVFAFANALEHVFQPRIYQQLFEDRERARVDLGRYLTPFFYIITGAALTLCLFCSEIMALVLPREYAAVNGVVIIYAAYYVMLFFGKIASTQLVYLKRTHVTALLLVATYAMNVALSLVFIRWWGPYGAAVATLVSGTIGAVAATVVAQKYLAFQWPAATITAIGLYFILATLAGWVVSSGNVPMATAIMIKIILLCIYVGFGLKSSLLGVFFKRPLRAG